jgi:hypothetical protein
MCGSGLRRSVVRSRSSSSSRTQPIKRGEISLRRYSDEDWVVDPFARPGGRITKRTTNSGRRPRARCPRFASAFDCGANLGQLADVPPRLPPKNRPGIGALGISTNLTHLIEARLGAPAGIGKCGPHRRVVGFGKTSRGRRCQKLDLAWRKSSRPVCSPTSRLGK